MLLKHFERILEKEIDEFYCFIDECEIEENRGNEVNNDLYLKYKSIHTDITLPEWIERAGIIGLTWEHCNRVGWYVDDLVNQESKRARVNYNAFEEYLIKRFLPISIGFPKPTIYIWDGRQFVENKGRMEKAIKEVLNPYFSEKQIRNHTGEIMYRVQLATLFTDPPFNKYYEFIPVKNGTLMIEPEYKLLPHSPAFGFTYCLNAKYDPNAKCPEIDQFISQIVDGDDRKALYEIPALCLMSEWYQYAYMLYGTGSNGKSTYLSLIKAFLNPKNVAAMTFQELCSNRFAVAELYGKLANICADIPADPVSYTGIFKMLTGGDLIKAEKKYKDPFYFVNRAKLIFSCNEFPETKDMTDAFWRRWILIEFPHKFSRKDDELIKKLTTEEELSGFLNRVLEALTRIKIKGVTITKTMEDIKKEWETRANPVAGFARHCVVYDPKSEVPKDEMYNAYRSFCEMKNLKVVSKTKFAIDLMKYVRTNSSKKRVGNKVIRVWTCVRLRCPECGMCGEEESSSENIESLDQYNDYQEVNLEDLDFSNL